MRKNQSDDILSYRCIMMDELYFIVFTPQDKVNSLFNQKDEKEIAD